MSYLQLLQQLREQQSPFEQFVGAAGEAARDYMATRRAEAQQRAKILQQQGQEAYRSQNFEAAARVVPQLQEALQVGYGIRPTVAAPVGAPIYGPLQQAPAVQPLPPMRADMPAMGLQPRAPRIPGGPEFERVQPVVGIPPRPSGGIPRQEIGRDFTGERTRADIRAGLMMEPSKLLEVSGALFDPETRQWVVSPAAQTPQTRLDLLQQRLESSKAIADERLRSAEERAAAQRALSMTLAGMRIGASREARATRNIWVTMPDGSRKRVPDTVGLVSQPGPKVVPAYNDENLLVGYVQVTPTPATGAPIRIKPPGKPAVAAPLTPAEVFKANELATKMLLMETPKAMGDVKYLTIEIAKNPALRSRYNELVKQQKTEIMAERQRAADEANRRGGAPSAQPPAAKLDPFEELVREAQGQRRK